jgi:hypothetical protein
MERNLMIHEEVEVGVMVVPGQVVEEPSSVMLPQTQGTHEDFICNGQVLPPVRQNSSKPRQPRHLTAQDTLGSGGVILSRFGAFTESLQPSTVNSEWDVA